MLVTIVFILFIFYIIYQDYYFKSDKFLNIKKSIDTYTKDCNDLNEHIEELKNTYMNIKKIDYGNAIYYDNSNYKFKRPKLKKYRESQNIYNCSLSVCRNAQQQPFKYICKYFNITPNEDSLENFEKILNDFSAAEQGKILLKIKRDEIVNSIIEKIPFLIRTFNKKKLIRKLGFNDIDFSELYFPKFTFKYISAGGNSSMQCEIVFNLENLNKFVIYLSDIIKFRKSIIGQRALMTMSLREKIKKRDNYTCKSCGISLTQEPHLLLEIDHIKPLSKGGMTTEDNLQTLCWKCNRTKSNKIINQKNH